MLLPDVTVWVDGRCRQCKALRVFERHVPAVRPADLPVCAACELWLDRHLAGVVAQDGAL